MKRGADVFSGLFLGDSVHGLSAIAALAVVCLLLAGSQWYVQSQLPGKMAIFAERTSPVKLTGNILQTEAFELPATLPIYGSSELDRPAANRPDEFFRGRPTDFSAFPIGRGGTTCLMIAQKVAALGNVARGKKAVIFLSPTWFAKEGVGENAVDANLTSPQLSAWLFSDELSGPLRQRIVQRLLDYPASLQDEMLLDHAVRCVAAPTWNHHIAFALLKPLGWAQNVIFRRLEYCAILREMYMYRRPGKGNPVAAMAAATSRDPDWTLLAAQAEASDRAHDDGAVYSATNALLPEHRRAQHIHAQTPGSRDDEFASKVVLSKEFDDLRLLVDVLKELRVDPLFISQPFNGIYRDLGGTSRLSRQVYYDKVAEVLAQAGYPLRDFSDHEEDRFFFNDAGHPSAKAWIFYDQAIDRFYHQIHG